MPRCETRWAIGNLFPRVWGISPMRRGSCSTASASSRLVRIQTMRTQVRDLDYDTPPAWLGAVTVSRAWAALQTNKAKSIPAIPVTNENGELYGMLSPSEIASYDMRTLSDSRVDRIPVFNLLSVLDGKILN